MDGASAPTNFRCLGRLTKDPEAKRSDSGKFRVEFSLAFRRSAGKETVFIDFVCMDEKLAEYIVETFHKGDFMHVIRAVPGNKLNRGEVVGIKFCVWDVMTPAEPNSHRKAVPVSTQEGVGNEPDEDIPY